jgi:hypothetical protein
VCDLFVYALFFFSFHSQYLPAQQSLPPSVFAPEKERGEKGEDGSEDLGLAAIDDIPILLQPER